MRYGDYELTSDNEYNFIVKKHYINKKGKPDERILTYNGRLSHAIESFIDVLSIKKWNNEIKEMKDVLKLLEEIKESVSEKEERKDTEEIYPFRMGWVCTT